MFASVGRTFLSAAFEVDLMGPIPHGNVFEGQACIYGSARENKTNKVKSGGQECPPHASFL